MASNSNSPRSLSSIARDIRNDWKPVNSAARPYLEAMADLNSIDDMYLHDTAEEVVLRFLSNASSWRGPTARTIKAELKQLLVRK
jgi:hypothetical protein